LRRRKKSARRRRAAAKIRAPRAIPTLALMDRPLWEEEAVEEERTLLDADVEDGRIVGVVVPVGELITVDGNAEVVGVKVLPRNVATIALTWVNLMVVVGVCDGGF
jgi:hypothetical protein